MRQINDHINKLKQERQAANRMTLKEMPLRMLVKAKRSFLGSVSSNR